MSIAHFNTSRKVRQPKKIKTTQMALLTRQVDIPVPIFRIRFHSYKEENGERCCVKKK